MENTQGILAGGGGGTFVIAEDVVTENVIPKHHKVVDINYAV